MIGPSLTATATTELSAFVLLLFIRDGQGVGHFLLALSWLDRTPFYAKWAARLVFWVRSSGATFTSLIPSTVTTALSPTLAW